MTFQVLKYCKKYCIFDKPSDYVPALPFKIFRSLAEFWPQERSVPDWFESIALHSFCCDLKIKMNYSQHWLPDLTGNKSSYPLPHLCSTNKRSLQLQTCYRECRYGLLAFIQSHGLNDEKWLLRSLKHKICLGLNMYIWRTCQVCSIFKPWATCLAWTDVFDVF